MYIFIELIGLIRVYRDAKSYREGEWLENTNTAITGHIVYWLKTLIVLGGLYLILDYEKSLLSGAIIWIGTIACYFVAGVITSNVANLPLRMGYGGWHIKRPSKKKKTQ